VETTDGDAARSSRRAASAALGTAFTLQSTRAFYQLAAGRPFQYHTIKSVVGGSAPSSRRRVAF
jgi:hypothetical protein